MWLEKGQDKRLIRKDNSSMRKPRPVDTGLFLHKTPGCQIFFEGRQFKLAHISEMMKAIMLMNIELDNCLA